MPATIRVPNFINDTSMMGRNMEYARFEGMQMDFIMVGRVPVLLKEVLKTGEDKQGLVVLRAMWNSHDIVIKQLAREYNWKLPVDVKCRSDLEVYIHWMVSQSKNIPNANPNAEKASPIMMVPDILFAYKDNSRIIVASRLVPNSNTFGDYVKDTSVPVENFKKALKSVCTTLDILQKEFGFTHGDLHASNVLVNKDGCWMIDFGMSEIAFKQQRFRPNNNFRDPTGSEHDYRRSRDLRTLLVALALNARPNRKLYSYIFSLLDQMGKNVVLGYMSAGNNLQRAQAAFLTLYTDAVFEVNLTPAVFLAKHLR